MSPELVINLVQNALYVLIIVAAPVLLVSLLVGLLVSVLQAATQINEMTLTFIPKLLALFVTLVLAGPVDDQYAGRLHRAAVPEHSPTAIG